MDLLPAGIAAEQALLRQNVALATIKQSADADKLLVGILDKASQSLPVSRSSRGSSLNIKV